MNLSIIRSNIMRASLLLAALTSTGCTANYATDSGASVQLFIVSINGGNAINSDVLTDGAVTSNAVTVAVALRYKNQNGLTVPSVPNAVFLERYEIRYRRSDGRGVEGQDVPYTISGNMTVAVDVQDQSTTLVGIEIVRAQAKLEPPLRNLRGVVTDVLGGAQIITMFAEITIHARTVSGKAVTATGTLQVNFADFADSV
jgi:uncharacterized protein YuzE